MEKVQTPVVAGVSGAAILAALLSFGHGDAKKPAESPTIPLTRLSSSGESQIGGAPNQEGPWRAVCEEYAPNGAYDAIPKGTIRGYRTDLFPKTAPIGAIEFNTDQDLAGQSHKGQSHKIAVHKQLIGELDKCVPRPRLGQIRLIIATLPDPDKTEMRLEFDRFVEALEKAAAVRGFHYSGYWFPWSSRQIDPVPHKEDEVEVALLRREQPGILLFHNDAGERLFIFVVGETPTSGINRIQMVQALHYRQDLINALHGFKAKCASTANDAPGCPKLMTKDPGTAASRLDGPLMISGPHFSGSLVSLSEVLQDSNLLKNDEASVKDPLKNVKIVSPNASSEYLIKEFKKTCDKEDGCLFRSLTISAEDKNKEAGSYLKGLGYKPDQIAELVEDESGFGDSETSVSSDDSKPFGLVLSFPRELSAAQRQSDQESEQLAESGSKLLSLTRGSANIKLASQEPIERDRPSTYASDAEMSEVSNALEADVRVIREKHIQCVVISTTNPLDRIFLLEYIHDRLPNIRLAAEDADQLVVSHPHFVDLTGTIVISSLPTVPEFAAVRSSYSNFISFTGEAAEDQFLSETILLDDGVMGRDFTTDDDSDIRPNGPWISIAGEEGFELIPAAANGASTKKLPGKIVLFGKEDDPNSQKPKTASNGVALEYAGLEHTPRTFLTFSIAIFLLTLWHLVWLVRSTESVPPKHAYVTSDLKRPENRTYNLLALNNQIFLMNCLLLSADPIINPFKDGLIGLRLIAAGAWFFSCIMLFPLMTSINTFSVKLARQALSQKGLIVKITFLFFAFLICWYLLSSVWFFAVWHTQNQTEYHRILNLDDGLSPVVPIAAVLVAWALWAVLQLRRAKWSAYRKVDLDTVSEVSSGPLGKAIREDMRATHKQIDSPTMGLRQIVFVLFFVGVIAWTEWSSLRGIEPYVGMDGNWIGTSLSVTLPRFSQLCIRTLLPPAFEWWFAIWGFVMLLMTVVQTTYQLYQIWKSLARLLRRLEPTRMKRAFEQIGEDQVHIKLWDLGKAQMRFDEIALIIESLHKMKYSVEAAVAEEALGAYQKADLEGRQPTEDQREALNNALNSRVQDALQQLEENAAAKPQAKELDRYLALRLSTLVRYVLLQMRNSMWFVIYGYFLAVVSVTFYPFQGGKNLSDMLGVTFVIVLVILAVLVTQVLRDPMLKRLEDRESNPGSILQPLVHLISVGGLPALALLAWQFPWFGQVAFSWLRPLLNTFR